MNGAELLVAALENEGVQRIFGVPGEENLDVVEALRRSRIELVLTRHEQAAAFMAATHGRLTGKPGVCITTLGPGALNLTTGAAYALLGAMPMVMITGQKGVLSRKQASFQIVDIVSAMTPLTKMADQIVSAATIPTMVREAFRVAQLERPGPVHLELPEDIAHAAAPDMATIPPHPIDLPIASSAALDRAAKLILNAERPLIMLGAAASRPRLADALSEFVRRVEIPFFNTQMGKGAVTGENAPLHGNCGAVGARLRSSRDRSRGSDHRHRPRHGGEAALLHGSTRADGAACRLSAGHGRGSVLSASRAHRRCRAQPHAPGRSARTQTAESEGVAASARGHPRPYRRPSGRKSLSSDSAADRSRCAPGDAGGWDRLPRQRHVQDLVCAQLPHPRRQHAACSTMRSPRWARGCRRRSWPLVSTPSDACSPCAATAAS